MAPDFNWLSNNLDISYPFVAPSPIVTIGAPVDLGHLVADAVLYTSEETEARWRLDALDLTFDWPNPPAHGTVTVRNDAGFNRQFFDSEFHAYNYGRWVVTEWVVSRETFDGFTSYDFVLRLLWSRDDIEGYGGIALAAPALDASWFEQAVVHQGPARVRRTFFKAGVFFEPLGSELLLAGGFNVDLGVKTTGDDIGFRDDAAEVAPTRPETVLRLDATPGGGIGRYLRCAPADLLRTLNGLGPTEQGDFLLDPRECYRLEKPIEVGPIIGGDEVDETAMLYPHRVALINNCKECCSCEDYVLVYENLQRLWLLAQGASRRIYTVLDQYKTTRALFLVKTGAGSITLSAGMTSSRSFTLHLSIIFVNGTATPVSGIIAFPVEVTTAPAGLIGEYIDKTGIFRDATGTTRPLDIDGSWPSFAVTADGVIMPPGSMVAWSGAFAVKKHVSIARPGASVTATVVGIVNGQQYGEAVVTSELKAAEERD